MNKTKITINGKNFSVPSDYTVLKACRENNIDVPSLCFLDMHRLRYTNEVATCRVCMVEIKGRKTLAPSCVTKVEEDMVIKTNSTRAVTARRMAVELLLSDHPNECFTCAKNLSCELQKLAADLGIRAIKWSGKKSNYDIDSSSYSIVRDRNKCIMCRRCETACNIIQTCGILSTVDRGFDSVVSTAFDFNLGDTSCTFCGQCVAVCPVGALYEQNYTHRVWRRLNDPSKHVVVQTAPAVRVTIGEMFGTEPGTDMTGQMVTALKSMGFDAVFDTDFAADLTIMEEATEIVQRITSGKNLPILTSCCPAWVKFIEHNFPDLLHIPSTCKSPQQMLGAIIKTYYAQKMGVDPESIVVVSIMPCVAKKAEANRIELTKDNRNHVDFVLTTRELGLMIKETGVDIKTLEKSEFDNPLGESSGAGVIFGTTGGVIEAAVRTAYEWITGDNLDNVEFKTLRGMDGIRTTTLKIENKNIRIGMAHGLGNARKLLEAIRDGKEKFEAIEIMACPGGCIGGGGQPFHRGDDKILEKRSAGIYKADTKKKIRKSHENPSIKKLYKEFLGSPGSKISHDLLHTYYEKKEKV